MAFDPNAPNRTNNYLADIDKIRENLNQLRVHETVINASDIDNLTNLSEGMIVYVSSEKAYYGIFNVNGVLTKVKLFDDSGAINANNADMVDGLHGTNFIKDPIEKGLKFGEEIFTISFSLGNLQGRWGGTGTADVGFVVKDGSGNFIGYIDGYVINGKLSGLIVSQIFYETAIYLPSGKSLYINRLSGVLEGYAGGVLTTIRVIVSGSINRYIKTLPSYQWGFTENFDDKNINLKLISGNNSVINIPFEIECDAGSNAVNITIDRFDIFAEFAIY